MKNDTGLYLIEDAKSDKSDAHVLLITPEKLKRDSYLDANVDDNHLRVAICSVQDIIVEDVLGTCLYEHIKYLICSGLINDPLQKEYKWLLNDYISRIFIYGVPAELNIPVSYKMRNSGTVRVETDTTNNPLLSELQYTTNWYKKKRDFYISRAVEYLLCNCECFGVCKCGRCKCRCKKEGLKKKYSLGFPIEGGKRNKRI